ncbi:DUF4030 domain-containing protein [Fictibacillus aquaticus]|uniref:DUF4030 domain-containing protein n=1 Tax=Fictibacillus aquaticus TaxID=2021314 RepID=A0A235F8L0_9BACL|nr:DUF4030 domain-containing protein [Fictibacillus aquaticus]OYD57691.1 hypothetical protein CGZ90_13590 [Fictibacillus aquaticus]
MSSAFKQTFNEIEIPEELTQRVKLGVSEAKAELVSPVPAPLPSKMSWHKKAAYTICTAAAAAGLLIGSAFVSPTVQNALANFPFFSSLFKSGPVIGLIHDELRYKGYNVMSIAQPAGSEKIISIYIDAPDKEIQSSEADVKKIANGILASQGIDAYTVKVEKYIEFTTKGEYVFTAEEKILDQIHMNIHETLRKQGYSFQTVGLGIDKSGKLMEYTIEVPRNEKRTAEMLKTAEQIVADASRSEKVRIVTLNIEDLETEGRKSNIVSALSEGLMGKSEYKVNSISHKMNPFTLIIKTSVHSKDENAQKVSANIQNAIDEFLSSPEMKDYVKGISYEIQILSKDKKKLN